MTVLRAGESGDGSVAGVTARILARDEAMLSLATHLEGALPAPPPDLTMRQLYALVLLAAKPRHVGEVATVFGITISSASGLLNRLVRARLVARQPSEADRRLVMCRLTPEGDRAIRRVLEIGRLRLERILTELDLHELLEVEHALDLLITAARRVIGTDGRGELPATSGYAEGAS